MSVVVIGPYKAGEIPPRLTVTFKDSAGAAISLAGFTAKFGYRKYGASWTTKNATVDADQVTNKGQAYYDWLAADMTTAGDFEGEVWVGNGATQRYASVRLAWLVRPALTPAPSI